jgi:hypothetical protein
MAPQQAIGSTAQVENMTQRDQMPTRLSTLQDQHDAAYYAQLTPAERIDMMWQLALDAWAFKGEPVTDHRVQKHIVRVIRRRALA